MAANPEPIFRGIATTILLGLGAWLTHSVSQLNINIAVVIERLADHDRRIMQIEIQRQEELRKQPLRRKIWEL